MLSIGIHRRLKSEAFQKLLQENNNVYCQLSLWSISGKRMAGKNFRFSDIIRDFPVARSKKH